jgi:GDPmannose 4,6-dehydratase
VGVHIAWEGNGVKEIGKNTETGQTLVRVDPRYFRLTEVDFLKGNPTKARLKLGWEPRVSFGELVKMMVQEDLKEAERDKLCSTAGFYTYSRHE